MSNSGNWSVLKIQQPDEFIYASDWNAEFQNVINNCNPDGVAGNSTSLTQMQTTKNPYEGEIPQLSSSLAEEIEELRYQISNITGEEYWYLPSQKTISQLENEITSIEFEEVTGGDLHDHTGTGESGGGALIGSTALVDSCIIESKYADLSIPSGALQDGCIINRCYADASITEDKLDPNIAINLIKQYYSTIIPGPISYQTVAQNAVPLPSQCYSIIDLAYTPKSIGSTLEISIRLSVQNDSGNRAIIILFINDTYYDAISRDDYLIISTKNQCLINYTFLYTVTSLNETNIKLSFTSPTQEQSFILATDYSIYLQPSYIYVDIKEIKNV